MKLIKCPKCHNEISSSDSKCIYCGLDKSTIEQELKAQELISEGKIEDTSKKKKTTIVMIELLIFLVIFILYVALFIPKILQITDYDKVQKEKDRCINYDGVWNNTTYECEYDY